MTNTEIVVIIINYLILGLIISMPIGLLIILKKYKSQKIMLICSIGSMILFLFLIGLFAWWADRSDYMLLEHFGYNIDGMSDTERLQYVAQEHIDKVRYIERSIGGVGWPIHAFFGFISTIPYLILIVIAIYYRLRESAQKSKETSDKKERL